MPHREKEKPFEMRKTKTIVITGCSRGLGRAMVRGLEARGHLVCGFARDAGALSSLGDSDRFRVADVSDDGAVKQVAREFIEWFGAPDILVNNAAVINANAPLWKVGAEEFSRLLSINLGGIANTVRWFGPSMMEQGRGGIVTFSSTLGCTTSSDVAPYCATKWGVEGLTRALAQDLPPGMAAVALNPGVIDTDMLRSCLGPAAASHLSPESWAEAAVPFLERLGPEHNGQSLTVPGQ